MTKERLKSPRARLFVALDLPEEVRSGIEAWGSRELRDEALRPVQREALHVTLAFLGYLPEKEIPRLAGIVETSEADGAPRVKLQDPIAKPSRNRPRIFALPLDSLGTTALQAELQERLIAERLYEPEKRVFWPHVTVARVRSEGRGSKRLARVTRQPGALPQELLQPFDAVRMTLYRSELQPQGAIYVPLAQVELSKRGRQ
ncbi:MAG TPA: RNA 2',3'-cyclic phosphodiesterase [Solirubrobacterales bacterium]|jgi:2'-5' RNA ligase